uniref:MHC class I-like antigen recognition-like domain-containing protein n=1 Tax=Zosterops lateralis melanops TaxID=1220523 RepID=A0A8D2PSN5_ZOSLA
MDPPAHPFLSIPPLPFPFSLINDPPNLCVPPVLHSLHYLAVAVSEPSPGVPQFMAIGFVDGIPITRYDSERGRMEPLTQWMKDGVDFMSVFVPCIKFIFISYNGLPHAPVFHPHWFHPNPSYVSVRSFPAPGPCLSLWGLSQ